MKYDQIFKQCSGVALIWHALKCWWQKVNGALTTAGSSPFPRRLASSRKRKSLKKKKKTHARSARSDAVVAVHVTTYVPQDHVEDEQDGENEQGNQDRFGHRRD